MIAADPVIAWPGNASLRDTIDRLRALNPQRNLRLARTGDECEYLFYDGSALDVFEIAMPLPASDDLMSGLTEVNREWWPIETDLGERQYGPHRFERTSAGDLAVRARSYGVDSQASRFAMRFQFDRDGIPRDQIGRIQGRWGIVRGEHELWEVDFAYLPADHFDDVAGRRKSDRSWWETTPIGTISFIDAYDLPFAIHIERAEAMLAVGSAFAIVGDLRERRYVILRPGGATIESGSFVVPEMPWFAFPPIVADPPSRLS